MDGIETLADVTVMAATNRPDIIDKALVRPGRFDRLIYIPPPDLQARVCILRIASRNMPLHQDVNLEEIARMMERFSGAEVTLVPREAAIFALSEDIMASVVRVDQFQKALLAVRPRITDEVLKGFENFKVGNS
jgi:transitional endoplasmic reticulum ATPase